VFNDAIEVTSRDSHSEITDDVDLLVDVNSHHINNMAQDNGCYNAEVERYIETIGNDVGLSHFTGLFSPHTC